MVIHIGTSKVVEPYKIGERTTNLKLEILNLNKKEVVSIDGISDQDFSEVHMLYPLTYNFCFLHFLPFSSLYSNFVEQNNILSLGRFS